MNLTLRQLRLFEAIVRLKSLTKAAGEQAISQSAASQSIRELEKQLGYGLFVKRGRELTLTESGQKALPGIRQALVQLESLKFPDSDFIGGPLRVAASETIASYLMPQLLADFVAKFPEVEPKLSISNTDGVLKQVEAGQASIGFIEGPAHGSNLIISDWCSDFLAAFLPAKSSLLKTAERGDWANLPWIVREKGSGTRAVFDQALVERNEQPIIAMSLSRQEAIKQSVRAGLGIGCLSQLALADELESGILIQVKCELNFKRRFAIVRSNLTESLPVIQQFENFVKQS